MEHKGLRLSCFQSVTQPATELRRRGTSQHLSCNASVFLCCFNYRAVPRSNLWRPSPWRIRTAEFGESVAALRWGGMMEHGRWARPQRTHPSAASDDGALLAYGHAGARQRTHWEVAGGDSANQGSQSAVFAERGKTARNSRSRTAAWEIAANCGRIGDADRLEQAMS